MEAIDWETVSAEEFATSVPVEENNLYEWKSGAIVDGTTKFRKELGTQVSAFANSGGGYIVLGVKNDRTIDGVSPENDRDRPTRKEWLVGKVMHSVAYPVSGFEVHRLPIAGEVSNAVYVIEVFDSLKAPHRCVDNGHYYYRLDGRSEIAPHFYVDLLFSRTTKAKLDLTVTRKELQSVGNNKLQMQVLVRIENVSMQCAERWGVILRSTTETGEHLQCKSRRLSEGAYIPHHAGIPLMPMHNESVDFVIIDRSDIRNPHIAWDGFSVEIIPVSQNFAGEPTLIQFRTGEKENVEMFKRINRICGLGRNEEF